MNSCNNFLAIDHFLRYCLICVVNDVQCFVCFGRVFRSKTVNEPWHDKQNKTNKLAVRVKKPWILSYPLSVLRRLIRLGRLVWVFAGRTVILLVLSWFGLFYNVQHHLHHDCFSWLYPRHLCRAVSFRLSVRMFVRSTFRHVRGIYIKFIR